MKNVVVLLISIAMLNACYSPSRVLLPTDENLINIAEEQEEYELIIMDAGFETWFATTWSPAKDRPISFYEHWNQRYVAEWNYKATRTHTARVFDNQIGYDPTINYGIGVERKLYYYFRWVDTKLGIPILNTRPPNFVI